MRLWCDSSAVHIYGGEERIHVWIQSLKLQLQARKRTDGVKLIMRPGGRLDIRVPGKERIEKGRLRIEGGLEIKSMLSLRYDGISKEDIVSRDDLIMSPLFYK